MKREIKLVQLSMNLTRIKPARISLIELEVQIQGAKPVFPVVDRAGGTDRLIMMISALV